MRQHAIIVVFLVVAITGCSTHLPVLSRTHCNDFTAFFEIPDGWKNENLSKVSSRVAVSLKPENLVKKGTNSKLSVGLSLDKFCYTRFHKKPITNIQRSLALRLKQAIFEKSDDTIRISENGVIHHPQLGELRVWNFQGDWYGNHLIVFVPFEGGYVQVELWAFSKEQHNLYYSDFKKLVLSIKR